jgi:hypothetical protein
LERFSGANCSQDQGVLEEPGLALGKQQVWRWEPVEKLRVALLRVSVCWVGQAWLRALGQNGRRALGLALASLPQPLWSSNRASQEARVWVVVAASQSQMLLGGLVEEGPAGEGSDVVLGRWPVRDQIKRIGS